MQSNGSPAFHYRLGIASKITGGAAVTASLCENVGHVVHFVASMDLSVWCFADISACQLSRMPTQNTTAVLVVEGLHQYIGRVLQFTSMLTNRMRSNASPTFRYRLGIATRITGSVAVTASVCENVAHDVHFVPSMDLSVWCSANISTRQLSRMPTRNTTTVIVVQVLRQYIGRVLQFVSMLTNRMRSNASPTFRYRLCIATRITGGAAVTASVCENVGHVVHFVPSMDMIVWCFADISARQLSRMPTRNTTTVIVV
eukprot:g355.t1